MWCWFLRLEVVLKVSGGCLDSVLIVSGGCLECVWRVSGGSPGGCLEGVFGVWKVSGK